MTGTAGILKRSDIIGLSSYWKQKRFAYTGSDLTYFGFHYLADASTSDSDWSVWKLTYTGDDLTLIEGPLSGSWDDRTSLDWI